MRRSSQRTAVRLISLLASMTGLVTLMRNRRRRRGDFRVFILAYHDVSQDGSEPEGVISRQRFQRHVRALKRHFRVEQLSNAAQQLDSPEGMHEDLLVLTFDDGYEGNYINAWPVLKEERVPASIFLTTGFIDGSELWFDFARRGFEAALRDQSRLPQELQNELTAAFGQWPAYHHPEEYVERLKYFPVSERSHLLESLLAVDLPLAPASRALNWDQVREMRASCVEMGGHTVSHPILSTLPRRLQESEIRQSKQRIADETGASPSTFAFPNGSSRDYDEDTIELLRESRFTAVCSMRRGSNRAGVDRYVLRRIGVGSDPDWVLMTRLSGLFDEEVRQRFIG